jgi:hypothetical protein
MAPAASTRPSLVGERFAGSAAHSIDKALMGATVPL